MYLFNTCILLLELILLEQKSIKIAWSVLQGAKVHNFTFKVLSIAKKAILIIIYVNLLILVSVFKHSL